MATTDATQGPNWAQMLLTGVSAAIDSQVAQPYYLSDPTYYTAGGTAGQAQATAAARAAVQTSPVIWIIGAVVLVLVIKLAGK